MIERGVTTGGVIAKVRCALDAVNGGVEKVHMSTALCDALNL
jgi:acetylglutamate kinase